MKIEMNTTHDLDVYLGSEDEATYVAKIDSDYMVQLFLHGFVESEGKVRTLWMVREDLLALRALITKALSIIP